MSSTIAALAPLRSRRSDRSTCARSEIVAAIKKVSPDKYRVDISMTTDDVAIAGHHDGYVTAHEYDRQAIYQTIVTEGHQQCNIPDYERWRARR